MNMFNGDKKREVVEKKDKLPVEMASFFDEQMEGTDKDSFAIPFIVILQSGSPQVKKSDGRFIEGSEEGFFLNTVNDEFFESFDFLPCKFARQMIEWIPRSEGGGLVAIHSVEECPDYEVKDIDGRVVWQMDNGHEIADTRMHYVLHKRPDDESWQPAVLALSKTQIKKSRKFMTVLSTHQEKRNIFTFGASTIAEQKDEHSWFGWAFKAKEQIDMNSDLAQQGLTFMKAIKSGEAKADNDSLDKASPDGGAREQTNEF